MGNAEWAGESTIPAKNSGAVIGFSRPPILVDCRTRGTSPKKKRNRTDSRKTAWAPEESGRSPQWSVLPFGSRGNQVRFQDARGRSMADVPRISRALEWAVVRDTFIKCNRRAKAGEDAAPRRKSLSIWRMPSFGD